MNSKCDTHLISQLDLKYSFLQYTKFTFSSTSQSFLMNVRVPLEEFVLHFITHHHAISIQNQPHLFESSSSILFCLSTNC